MADEKKEEIKEYLALNSVKWVRKMTAIVNKFDGRCRQMLLSRPGRPVTDYCEKCQKLMKETMEECLR